MGAPSPRRRAPDEAATAVLVGVERDGPADHGGGGKRAEVAAVEAVTDFPVHQEQLAVRDDAAALPDGQRIAAAIAVERIAHRHAVDGDGEAGAANPLARER